MAMQQVVVVAHLQLEQQQHQQQQALVALGHLIHIQVPQSPMQVVVVEVG
jgi:hypothetical protein